MDLFPVIKTTLNPPPDNALTWLSNISSFVPQVNKVSEERSQSELLRAAERYLQSSSDEDLSEEEELPTKQSTANPRSETGRAQAVSSMVPDLHPVQLKPAHLPKDPPSSKSDAPNVKKHKNDRKSSKSKSSKRHKSSSSNSQHHKHGSSSDASDGELELSKMRKLERKAAVRGRPGSAAGAGIPGSLPSSGMAGPGGSTSYYFDTHGDVQNVLYDKLYAGNVSVLDSSLASHLPLQSRLLVDMLSNCMATLSMATLTM